MSTCDKVSFAGRKGGGKRGLELKNGCEKKKEKKIESRKWKPSFKAAWLFFFGWVDGSVY